MSYQEHQKDATYITVSSRPTPDSEPCARIVKSMSLRAAIDKGQIVRLVESGKTGGAVKPADFEVNKFFRRLSFKNQVRHTQSGGFQLTPGPFVLLTPVLFCAVTRSDPTRPSAAALHLKKRYNSRKDDVGREICT